VILALASSSWLRGGELGLGPAPVVLGGAAAACAIAVVLAWRAAPRVMPAALREVAALDRQQLAHLDIHPPTALERMVIRLLPAGARPIFAKDARMVRRRHPLAYVIGISGLIAQWVLAATASDGMLAWSASIAAAMVLYAALLARRLREPPIEQPRVLAALPLAAPDITRAKRSWLVLWLTLYIVLGVAPVVVRTLM